jgi:hypothetical protein
MNVFFLIGSSPCYSIAVNIDGDPEALYIYNYKNFTSRADADRMAGKMQEANRKLNFNYWDFGL